MTSETFEQQFATIARRETGQIVAHLVSLVGELERAEELWHETLIAAMEAWRTGGVPQKPGAWLTTAARNRALDALRRERRLAVWHEQLARETACSVEARDEGELFPDERLRLLFTCCHPALTLEAQVALTLRLVGGLTTAEVARAFLLTEPTVAQRLVRAKRIIREKALPYVVPGPEELPERLAPVLQVVNLVFNEGYVASGGDTLVRRELQQEAIRLGELLALLLPAEVEVHGLLALMRLQASRTAARTDASGALVLLEHQDRARWDRELIGAGLEALGVAAQLGPPGPFTLQAHLAACHSAAHRWEETDWSRIAALYQALEVVAPSPVITLNRAVAVSMSDGPEAALQLIDRSPSMAALSNFHMFFATRADLLRRLGRTAEAIAAYRRAISLATNARERAYLESRLAECASTQS